MNQEKDFPYYGVEDGDSCYCGDNADKIVPAQPHDCELPCSGNALEVCGSAYRMNAYGPIFRNIEPDEIVFRHETVFPMFEINIDLKLEENKSDEKQNVFGFTVENATYPNVDSQIPSVYLTPDNVLQICMQVDAATVCELTSEITADKWINLWIEQWCWVDESDSNVSWCTIYTLIDDIVQWFWYNRTPVTYRNVDGIVGNTYGGEFQAASGYGKKFVLYSHESREAPSDKLSAVVDAFNIDIDQAINNV